MQKLERHRPTGHRDFIILAQAIHKNNIVTLIINQDSLAAAAYFLEEDVRAPQERHLDEAFFRGYQKLEPDAKEQLRKILSTFKKNS